MPAHVCARAILPSRARGARPGRVKEALGHRSGRTWGAWANWRPREQKGLKGRWLNWARERPGLCLELGPAAGRAIPAAELRFAAGTQRRASKASPGEDESAGGRGKGVESPNCARDPGPLDAPECHSTPVTPTATLSSPSFAATLLEFPTVPAAPPAAPGRCCPLVSAARAAGCCEPAASSQLLDILSARNWKKRAHSRSSNLREVFSPKPPY